MDNIAIERIDENSPYLDKVKELGRRHNETLGFFPEGAFEEHAAKQCVLIARHKSDLLGYLLYRVVWRGGAWQIAVIVHLCVDDQYRGKGVASALVDELHSITKDSFLRLELRCRRDYEANDVWPRLHFKYSGETQGRGGHPLVKWEMPLRQLPLLALLEEKSEKRFRVVIDANILYRLQDPVPTHSKTDKELSEEAKALQEDWLAEDVALLITDETLNEIERNNSGTERARRRAYAEQFVNLSADLDAVKKLERQLESYLSVNSKNFRSDIKQLAYAIAGSAHFFITQDTDLLKKSDSIHSDLGIKILSPGEFIRRIDEVTREVEYHPDRLGGSRALKMAKLRSDQIRMLHPSLRSLSTHEKKNSFESRLRRFIASPSRYDVEICTQEDDKPLALIVYDRANPSELSIPMLRISGSPLAGTVLRYLLRRAIITSAREGCPFTTVTNAQDQAGCDLVLEECGFTRVNDQWIKCGLPCADTHDRLLQQLCDLAKRFPDFGQLLGSVSDAILLAVEKQDPLMLVDVERRLWPAKILDASIPTYIIPIKRAWAEDLFDEDSARQTLWGSREDLVLGNENVYYRSKQSAWTIVSPARILWYISRDTGPLPSMQIRACSYLDEVIIGKAKDLFRQFQRLGIYEWHDVLRTAHNDANNHIMAIRFSNTESLPHPIDLPTLKLILQQEEGKKPVLQSPQLIKPSSFARIYQMAISSNGVNR